MKTVIGMMLALGLMLAAAPATLKHQGTHLSPGMSGAATISPRSGWKTASTSMGLK
jgi:hypothetical protein